MQPHHGTDPVPVFDTQVGLTPSNISTTKIKNSELHPTQHRPQFDKNSVSIVAQPAKNPGNLLLHCLAYDIAKKL